MRQFMSVAAFALVLIGGTAIANEVPGGDSDPAPVTEDVATDPIDPLTGGATDESEGPTDPAREEPFDGDVIEESPESPPEEAPAQEESSVEIAVIGTDSWYVLEIEHEYDGMVVLETMDGFIVPVEEETGIATFELSEPPSDYRLVAY